MLKIESKKKLTELGVKLKALFTILQSQIKGSQLGVASRSVAVVLRVLGVSHDGFRVVFDGLGVVSHFEQFVSKFLLHLSLFRVYVGLPLQLFDHLLGIREQSFALWSAVLEHRLLKVESSVVPVLKSFDGADFKKGTVNHFNSLHWKYYFSIILS